MKRKKEGDLERRKIELRNYNAKPQPNFSNTDNTPRVGESVLGYLRNIRYKPSY